MLYYYKKIGDGKDAGKYCKVTVNDENHLGTKDDPFEVVDAEIVDEIKNNRIKPLYQNIQKGLTS